MHFRWPIVLSLLPALGACATADMHGYPNLDIREAERVSGQMEPGDFVPYVPPPTPAAVLDRVDQLVAEAATAHDQFQSDANPTREIVASARGAAVGSESWARAQVALAGLESSRSRAMIALADLDRLYVDGSVEGTELGRIAAARDKVATMVDTENGLIDSLLGQLP